MEGGPTEEEHSQNYEDHNGDFLLGFVQGSGIGVQVHVPQPVEHHGVEDADGGYRNGKAKDEGVDPAGFEPKPLRLGEIETTTLDLQVVGVDIGKDDEREDYDGDQDPDAQADNPGCSVCAVGHPLGPDCSQHHQVPVYAHHCQEINAGEDIVVIYGQDDLAEDFSKGPVAEEVLHNIDGQDKGEQVISDSKVQDEHVGHSLHLGGLEDHIDDSCVACEPHSTDHRVDHRQDNIEISCLLLEGEVEPHAVFQVAAVACIAAGTVQIIPKRSVSHAC